MNLFDRTRVDVLSARVDVVTWDLAIERLQLWAERRESRYVCHCNVHSVVETWFSRAFGRTVNSADMVMADGAPVAWMLRRLGFAGQQRLNGPDLMWKYCEAAAQRDESIYLYGATPATLEKLQARLLDQLPGLRIAGAWSPPFRRLTDEEVSADVARINASGAGTVWISLGCPRQEQWMAAHRGRIAAVMIGVGAAFDYHAGTLRRAPQWMQRMGLEWFFRLCAEPRRLWKRYLVTNTVFIIGAALQLMTQRQREPIVLQRRERFEDHAAIAALAEVERARP